MLRKEKNYELYKITNLTKYIVNEVNHALKGNSVKQFCEATTCREIEKSRRITVHYDMAKYSNSSEP